jgi:hypothetical protein
MNKRLISIFLVVLALISIGSVCAAAYFYQQYQRLQANPQATTEKELEKMLKTISTVMELPTEKPSIATILDTEKLKGQAFFQKAKNGDKVIIFEQARRVLLYRPDTGRVVDFAPLILEPQKTATSPETGALPTDTPEMLQKTGKPQLVSPVPTERQSP